MTRIYKVRSDRIENFADVETYADIRRAALRADEISASGLAVVGWVEDPGGAVLWGRRPFLKGSPVFRGMPEDQRKWSCPGCSVKNLAPTYSDPYLSSCPICGADARLLDVAGELTAFPL